MDDLTINGPNGPLRVRRSGRASGLSEDDMADLVRKLVLHHSIEPEVTTYSSPHGVLARWSQDDSGPLVDLGDDSAHGEGAPGRLPAYDKLDAVYKQLQDWSGRRPTTDLQTPVMASPRADLRRALLEKLSSAPEPDREGEGRRSLEGAALAGLLGVLTGQSGRATAAAELGAARGVHGAFAERFADASRRWQQDTAAAGRAVTLDDSAVKSHNDTARTQFGMDRDVSRGKLADWQAEGKGIHDSYASALAELKGQQADREHALKTQTEESKRQQAAKKAEDDEKKRVTAIMDKLMGYNADGKQVFLDALESQNALPSTFPIKRGADGKWQVPGDPARAGTVTQPEREQREKTKAEKDRLARLSHEADTLRRDLGSGKLSVGDRLRARRRLAEIKKFAGVGPGDTLQDEVQLTPSQEQAKKDRAAGRAAADARAAKRATGGNSDAGPKAGALARYQTLRRNGEALADQVRQAQEDVKKWEETFNSRPLTIVGGQATRPGSKEEKAAHAAAQAGLASAKAALQSNLNARIKLETDYPEIKVRAGVEGARPPAGSTYRPPSQKLTGSAPGGSGSSRGAGSSGRSVKSKSSGRTFRVEE